MERIAAITESMQTKPTRRPSSPSLRGRSMASTGDDKTRPHSALHSDDEGYSGNDGSASEFNRKAGQEQSAKARYDDRDIDKARSGPTSSHTGATSTANAVNNKRPTVAAASEYDDDEFEFEAEEVRQQHK